MVMRRYARWFSSARGNTSRDRARARRSWHRVVESLEGRALMAGLPSVTDTGTGAPVASVLGQVGTGFQPLTVTAPRPRPVADSDLSLRVDYVGSMPGSQAGRPATNAASPVQAGSQLLTVDQYGYVYRGSSALLTPATAPAGITPTPYDASNDYPRGRELVLNAAADAAGTHVFVVFTSFTVPAGVPVTSSPRPPGQPGWQAWQVLYRYDFDGTALTNPRAVRAFEVDYIGHTGGGLVVLGDGSLLYGIGDTGYASQYGGVYPQDGTNHLGKILHVNPADGTWSVAAKGVRNPQRFAVYQAGGEAYLTFVDIGARLAEELDAIKISTLLDPATVKNFGWGINPDGKNREGTFYIDGSGNAVGIAPTPEPGFLQPTAQWGREQAAFVAGSGPVRSTASFTSIASLFGNLTDGTVMATTGGIASVDQAVLRVNLYNGPPKS